METPAVTRLVQKCVTREKDVKFQVIVRCVTFRCLEHAPMTAAVATAQDQGCEPFRRHYSQGCFPDLVAQLPQAVFQLEAAIQRESLRIGLVKSYLLHQLQGLPRASHRTSDYKSASPL